MPRGGRRKGAGRPKNPPTGGIGSVKPQRPKASGKNAAKSGTVSAAIRQAKNLTLRLLSELDAVTTHIGELEDLIIDETADDKDMRRRNAMLRAIELGSRAATLKILLAATRAWVDLEHPTKAPGAKPGKKQRAEAAATTAGEGTEWSQLVDETTPQ